MVFAPCVSLMNKQQRIGYKNIVYESGVNRMKKRKGFEIRVPSFM
jgi:hypothetical protein